MTLKVGLIVGREWSFPPAFIDEVNRRNEGVVAEYVKIGGTSMDEPCPYSVIIDRISHEVPYYRVYLRPPLQRNLVLQVQKRALFPTKTMCQELYMRRACAILSSPSIGRRLLITWACLAS